MYLVERRLLGLYLKGSGPVSLATQLARWFQDERTTAIGETFRPVVVRNVSGIGNYCGSHLKCQLSAFLPKILHVRTRQL